jgi:membrane-associated phospholipid phosphatase
MLVVVLDPGSKHVAAAHDGDLHPGGSPGPDSRPPDLSEARRVGFVVVVRVAPRVGCSCVAWGAVALLYFAAVGTTVGRRVDDAVFVRAEPFARAVSDLAIATVNAWTLAVVSVSAILVTARRGELRTAAGVALVVACANGSSFVASRVLGELLMVDGEVQRALGQGFFPSGHATAAMTMAWAVVMAAPPRHARRAMVVACSYASIVGVSLFGPGNHYASDVLGSILITVAWEALTRDARAGGWAVERGPARTVGKLVAIAATAVLLTLAVFGVRPDREPALTVASAVVTVAVFAVGHAAAVRPRYTQRAARSLPEA